MPDVTFWMGPVSNAQVAPCFIPGGVFPAAFTCRNPFLEPIPTCQQMIQSYDWNGRFLPSMLRSRQIDPASVSRLFIGSFSAGHGALKDRILLNAADRAAVTGVYLADSTYTDWIRNDPKQGAAPKSGYIAFMRECLTSPKLFVATAGASTPMDSTGKPLPSSAQSMWALATEIERTTGRKFEPLDASWSSPRPETAAVLKGDNGGMIALLDYGSRVTHPQHPTLIAPQAWNKLVLPWAGSSRCGESIAMHGLGDGPASCPLPPKPEPFPEGFLPDPSTPGFLETEPKEQDSFLNIVAFLAATGLAYAVMNATIHGSRRG